MLRIPENYKDFFHWVKETTESFWSKGPLYSSDDFIPETWAYGAKWVPLTEDEINAIEQKYGVNFMPEHREFLKILHTIDRKEEIEQEPQFEGGKPTIEKRPFFYNWLEDESEIRSRLDWPYRTILQDVLGPNGIWLKSWGNRPASDEDKERIFTNWLNNAPRLVPLTSHRFLVSEPNLTDRPALSVYGSDIIVYGWDLRIYLLNELRSHLNLLEVIYDKEAQCNFIEFGKDLKTILASSFADASQKDIPYWKEMILIWSSGWSSFGLKSPFDNGETVQPIMKTYVPENGENSQKRFIG
ncbi:hypothetical protein Q4E93_13045 [Flavitalea sp. BT771]|uniref:hypothetical protein n=1 Tax=Flavitalea sp. BT771 TaxID=3063329 RepID=UPI0026E3FAFB|nr:hypothetical protein [Flavitalea sp. BT771]MDO6431524.1 hypothetical protein [Flavitalea sp. BT771]MDV6220432.1 hypothetical protein [Flavitalea sp. BT771]